MQGFSYQLFIAWKNVVKNIHDRDLEYIDTYTFPKVKVLFCMKFYGNSMVFCIVLEMHGFSHRFLILWENTVKAIPGRDLYCFQSMGTSI